MWYFRGVSSKSWKHSSKANFLSQLHQGLLDCNSNRPKTFSTGDSVLTNVFRSERTQWNTITIWLAPQCTNPHTASNKLLIWICLRSFKKKRVKCFCYGCFYDLFSLMPSHVDLFLSKLNLCLRKSLFFCGNTILYAVFWMDCTQIWQHTLDKHGKDQMGAWLFVCGWMCARAEPSTGARGVFSRQHSNQRNICVAQESHVLMF